MKYFPMDELDFKPIEFEEFTFQVGECVDYVEQLQKRARIPKESLSVEERDANPALAFTALVRAYSQTAPSDEYYREQLAAQSEPGATVERFAGVSAASYHEVALEIVRMLLSAVADVFGIWFIDSMRPSKEGGFEGYQVFLPDTDQWRVDRPECMNRLAEVPSFDAPRLRAFLDKEAARLRSAPPDASTAGSKDHNGTPSNKSGITTLADCAYRVNQLCRSEQVKAEAKRLIAEIQHAHDEFRKEVSDWQKRKRHYFEVEAIADDELLDDASHYRESDLHWQSYTRVVYVAELGSVPSGMSDKHFRALPYYDSPGGTRPTESLPAGDIEITAWAPTEFLDCNSPNPQLPLPPENIGRAYRLGEIVAALVAIHDAGGRFEPIVPRDDPICKHWLFQLWYVGKVKTEGNDEWAPGLDPLLARVEAEWAKLVEPTEERGGLGFKKGDEEAEESLQDLGSCGSTQRTDTKEPDDSIPALSQIKYYILQAMLELNATTADKRPR